MLPDDQIIRYTPYGYRNETDDWYLKRHVDELISQCSALPQPVDSDAAKAFQTQRRKDYEFQRKVCLHDSESYLFEVNVSSVRSRMRAMAR